MSYHDGYRPAGEGIAVVNPLIEIENKLARIKKLIADIDSLAGLTAIDLKEKIDRILAS